MIVVLLIFVLVAACTYIAIVNFTVAIAIMLLLFKMHVVKVAAAVVPGFFVSVDGCFTVVVDSVVTIELLLT